MSIKAPRMFCNLYSWYWSPDWSWRESPLPLNTTMIWTWMVWWLFTEDKVTLPILNTFSQTTDHENKSTNAANKAIAEKNRIKRMKGITTTTTIATAILIWTRMVWWLFNQDKVIGQSKQSRGSGQTVFNRSMVFIFVIVVTSDIMCTNTVKYLRILKCNYFFCIARWIKCNHFLQGLFRVQCKMNRTSLVSWRYWTGSFQDFQGKVFLSWLCDIFQDTLCIPHSLLHFREYWEPYLTYNLYCFGASNWTLDAINWTFGASNWSFGAINWTFDAINWTFGATASAILAKLQPRGRLLHLVGGDDVRLEASQAAMLVSINL